MTEGVSLRPVTRDDLRPLFRLKVRPDQAAFVAANEFTLAQAAYETGAHVWTICRGDTPVGLIAAIDMRTHHYREPHDDPDSIYVWRLLIGHDHQRKGLGSAAMRALMHWGRENRYPRITVSVVESNTDGRAFYARLGFAETGVIADGEVVLTQDL